MEKLDLHGMRHEFVKPTLIRFIEDRWRKDIEVEIITGNSPKMKTIVKDILNEYKLEYLDGGFLGLKNAIITTTI